MTNTSEQLIFFLIFSKFIFVIKLLSGIFELHRPFFTKIKENRPFCRRMLCRIYSVIFFCLKNRVSKVPFHTSNLLRFHRRYKWQQCERPAVSFQLNPKNEGQIRVYGLFIWFFIYNILFIGFITRKTVLFFLLKFFCNRRNRIK